MNNDTMEGIEPKSAIHGKSKAIYCKLKGCTTMIPYPRPNQKFCCPDHQKTFWGNKRAEVSMGAKVGKPHCGTIQNSQRLRKMLRALSDYKEHTTKELQRATGGVAIGSTINDLRHNGFKIECRYIKTLPSGSKEYGYTLIKL